MAETLNRVTIERYAHRLLRSLVHANVVISLAGVGVAITTYALLGLPPAPIPVAFAFSAVFFAYTLNRLWDRAEDGANLPGRTAFIDRYGRYVLGFALFIYGIGVAAVVAWEPWFALIAPIPPLATWLYSNGPFKQAFLVKNAFVGLMWGAIPFGIGVVTGRPMSAITILTALLIAWLITMAAIVFDIKDVRGDRLAGVRTLPTAIGVARTRRLAWWGVIGAIPLILLATATVTPRFLLLFGYVVYLGVAIPFASADRGSLYFGLVVDGEHVLVGSLAGVLLVFPAV